MLLGGLLLVGWLPFPPVVNYTISLIFASCVYLFLAREIIAFEPGSRLFYTAIGLALLLRLSFLTATPIGSDDIYRYMWDGKLQTLGINPYRYAPNAPELDAFHSQRLPSSVNNPDLKSVYFPLGQWVSFAGYELSGENVWGYKLLLFLAELATLCGLFLLLKRLNLPSRFILLYALCPLPVMQFAFDAHIDGIGLPLLIFGFVSYLGGKKPLSYVLFALSMSIKPVALLLVPILFLREKGAWNKTLTFLVPVAVISAQFLPYALSSNVFDGLLRFAENWTFNGIVFESLYYCIPDNQRARIICAILLSVSVVIVALRKKDLLEAFYLSVLLLLLFSPVVHPWYVSWLVVLVPAVRRWSGIVFAATVSLTMYTVINYRLHGVWEQSAFILALEYLPVLVLLALEIGYPRTKLAVTNQ